MSINLNEIATRATLKEGKKESISIAQMKEAMKCILTELAGEEIPDVIRVIKRYRKAWLKKYAPDTCSDSQKCKPKCKQGKRG
jgi:NAD-dependent DNA ligase